jgi:cytidine deaminase
MAAIPKNLKALYDRATAVQKRAYAPYSRCHVGAAVKLESGEIFDGCNVENSSYGGSICAERSAILKAVSEKGAQGKPIRIKEVLVVTDASPPWPPCGFCRQTIAEFGKNPAIHYANLKGDVRSRKLQDLLPEAFRPEYLLR